MIKNLLEQKRAGEKAKNELEILRPRLKQLRDEACDKLSSPELDTNEIYTNRAVLIVVNMIENNLVSEIANGEIAESQLIKRKD